HAKAVFDKEYTPLAEEVARFELTRLPARLAAWEKEQAVKAKVPPAVAALLKIRAHERKSEQSAELLKWYRTVDAEFKKLAQRLHELGKKAPPSPKMLVATEGLPA